MLCRKPFRQGVLEYGCGQCLRCRINRSRVWACRLMLETHQHEVSQFVTLTYDQENQPSGGTLQPRDVQLFLKRLRQLVAPVRLRYYMVGEYGDSRGRPHYHLCLFGSVSAEQIKAAWGLGIVDVRVLSWDLALYITGYILKRWTNAEDPVAKKFLKGRHPEFARMSLRPEGLGAKGIKVIADALNTKWGARYISQSGDVPGVVRSQNKRLPIGRYLHGKLREALGYESTCPDGALAAMAGREFAKFSELGSVSEGARVREAQREQDNFVAEARALINSSKRGI